jgi:hypothetical protein
MCQQGLLTFIIYNPVVTGKSLVSVCGVVTVVTQQYQSDNSGNGDLPTRVIHQLRWDDPTRWTLLVELGCCSIRKDWNMKNNWLVVDPPLRKI